MPSGFEPGPASMACGKCLVRYNTGNATEMITGGLLDWIACTTTGASTNSVFCQGSDASWQRHRAATNGSANTRRREERRMNPRILCLHGLLTFAILAFMA